MRILPYPAHKKSEKVNTNRRKFICASLGLLLSQPTSITFRGINTLLLGVGTSIVSKPTFAEPVTICLAIASTIAGVIAANNRTDNGIGAVLKANLEYQKTMAVQLSNIQQNMALLLEKVNNLPGEMKKILYIDRLESLHSDIGVQIIRYTQEATVRASTFKSYEAWSKDLQTQTVLRSVMNNLDQLEAKVLHDRWFDSVSALYLISAVFTSLSARSVLGDKQPQLMAEAQRYLDIFHIISSIDESGSSASSLSIHKSNLDQLESQLRKQGFDLPATDSTSQQKIMVGGLAVQDFTERKYIKTEEHCTRTSRNIDIPPKCHYLDIYTKPRDGALEYFGFYLQVKPYFVTGNNKSSDLPFVEVRQFAPDAALTTEIISANTTLNDNIPKAIEVYKVEAITAEARFEKATSSNAYKNAEQNRILLTNIISKYNEESALALLDAGALIAVNTASRNVYFFFDKGIQ